MIKVGEEKLLLNARDKACLILFNIMDRTPFSIIDCQALNISTIDDIVFVKEKESI
jgi:hypothetical protein